jgi:hypothetical protein
LQALGIASRAARAHWLPPLLIILPFNCTSYFVRPFRCQQSPKKPRNRNRPVFLFPSPFFHSFLLSVGGPFFLCHFCCNPLTSSLSAATLILFEISRRKKDVFFNLT